MVVKPDGADAKSSFQRVQNLRNMNDFALFAKACCICGLGVVEKLRNGTATPLKDAIDLDVQTTALRGYVESADALQSRIRNAIDLVSAHFGDATFGVATDLYVGRLYIDSAQQLGDCKG
jgi:hypothetical protein